MSSRTHKTSTHTNRVEGARGSEREREGKSQCAHTQNECARTYSGGRGEAPVRAYTKQESKCKKARKNKARKQGRKEASKQVKTSKSKTKQKQKQKQRQKQSKTKKQESKGPTEQENKKRTKQERKEGRKEGRKQTWLGKVHPQNTDSL